MKIESMTDLAWYAATSTSTAFVGVCYWVVRRVLTDTKRLSLLEQRQDMQHKEIVTAIDATRDQVGRIESTNDLTAQNQKKIAQILDRMEKSNAK